VSIKNILCSILDLQFNVHHSTLNIGFLVRFTSWFSSALHFTPVWRFMLHEIRFTSFLYYAAACASTTGGQRRFNQVQEPTPNSPVP
jgi:hypothetical protein